MAGIAQTLSSPIIIIFVYLWCEVNTLLHCIGLVSILWPEDRKAIKFVWAEDTQLIEGSITQSIARKWKTRVLGSQYQNMTRELGGGGVVNLVKIELLHHVPCQQIEWMEWLESFWWYWVNNFGDEYWDSCRQTVHVLYVWRYIHVCLAM